MENTKVNTNFVTLFGKIVGEPVYSHSVYKEDFYIILLGIKRASEYEDIIPILVSDRAWNIKELSLDKYIRVEGSYRTFNKKNKDKLQLFLYVFADVISVPNETEKFCNEIKLEGYICREPQYRTTPLGREITDILLAVNRNYGKSDYIPCILWGRNAKYGSSLKVGNKVSISGRIQSRVYMKENESKIAYEVSVALISLSE